MVIFEKASGAFNPGEWAPLANVTDLTARISCPDCGENGVLPDTHNIAPNGVVAPALLCADCGWEDNVTLKDWQNHAGQNKKPPHPRDMRFFGTANSGRGRYRKVD